MVQRAISHHDLEQLSAFMDDQLRPAERRRIEIRLQAEPGLQKELDSLRYTRAMLRSLPPRRAPRNFTLSTAMVGTSRPLSWQPVFGMASALAVVLLVFVLLGDFLVIPGYVGMFPVSQAPAAEESQSLAQSAGEQTKEEALIFPTEAPVSTAAAEAIPQQPSAKAVVPGAVTPTPQATPATGMMADSLPESTSEERMMLEAAPMISEGTPPAAEDLAQTPSISNTLSLTETQVLSGTLQVQEQPGDALAESKESGPAPSERTQDSEPTGLINQNAADSQVPRLWAQVIFWMAELLLACLAVAAGLMSFYLWYAGRH